MSATVQSSQAIISPDSYYAQLHNDYLHLLEIDGKRYKSPTHFIYASMMPNKNLANSMIYQLNGATVRKKANGILFGKKAKGDRKLPQAHEIIMVKALEEGYKAVFGQPELRSKLLGTGTEGLVYNRTEHTFLPGDITVLGLNRAGNGQNKLGEILERIRGNLRQELLIRQKPNNQIHEVDRLFFAILRHKMLWDELNKGHFPIDYTLKGMFMASRNVSEENFHSMFLSIYPAEMRLAYWSLYDRWMKKDITTPPFPQEVIEEFRTGNDEWVIEAYNKAIKMKCVLMEYLNFLSIDYDTLVISIAKKKVIDDYYVHRFEFDKNGKSNQLSMEEYLTKYKITPDTLRYIGEEALLDLRKTIFNKYTIGSFISIPNFEENLASAIEGLRGIVTQGISFPKFIPFIEEPSQKFLELIAIDVPIEPSSPTQTYGGVSISEYYAPIHPDGACSEDVNDVCPLGGIIPPVPPVPANTSPIPSGPLGPSGPNYPPIKPSGDDDDDNEEEDNIYRGKDDGEDDGVEYDGEDEDDDEDREDREDQEFVFDEEGAVFGDNVDIDKAIEKNKGNIQPVPIKKYTPPPIIIRFSDENDYPYEWLSPFYITNIRINGMYFPSVAHYVAAKLATPVQFRNVSIRDWIQKDKESFDPQKKDVMTSPKFYYSIKEILEKLPKRIQEIYNLLYLRYASRAFSVKFRQYPFRQMLFETGKKTIVYRDEHNQNAVAGSELVKLLTDIRSKINDVVILKPLPNPEYGKDNFVLYDYIRERTRELIRSTVLFTRYRMSPREGYISSDVPVIGFDDTRIVIQGLYKSCRDINYNEYVSDPPDKYIADFEKDMNEITKFYFPGREIYDLNIPEVKDAIRAKVEGRSEDKMEDKMFVDFGGIIKLIWVHIVYTCIFLEEDLPEKYDQNQLRQKLKMIRGNLFNLEMGTRKEVAIQAIVNIIAEIHQLFPDQEQLRDNELNFVQDFIYPLANTRQNTNAILEESETYNTYNNLLEKITDVFNGNEQDVRMIKKLAGILDNVTSVSKDDKVFYNKLVIRLKFFAGSE